MNTTPTLDEDDAPEFVADAAGNITGDANLPANSSPAQLPDPVAADAKPGQRWMQKAWNAILHPSRPLPTPPNCKAGPLGFSQPRPSDARAGAELATIPRLPNPDLNFSTAPQLGSFSELKRVVTLWKKAGDRLSELSPILIEKQADALMDNLGFGHGIDTEAAAELLHDRIEKAKIEYEMIFRIRGNIFGKDFIPAYRWFLAEALVVARANLTEAKRVNDLLQKEFGVSADLTRYLEVIRGLESEHTLFSDWVKIASFYPGPNMAGLRAHIGSAQLPHLAERLCAEPSAAT